MDAATLGAVLAALPTQRTMRNSVCEALALAAETLKPSYLIAKTLATALRRSIWAGTSKDLAYALARAGDRIRLFDDRRKEYHAALRMSLEKEAKLRWSTEEGQQEAEHPDVIEQIRMRLYTAELAMKQAREKKACKEYGHNQAAWLQVLANLDEIGERIRAYPVCRAKVKEHGHPSCSEVCGLSFPNSLWSRSSDGHEYICKINWAAFEKKLSRGCDYKSTKTLQAWASQMRSRHGPIQNWPAIGCGARFYPTWEESTWVVEVRMARHWEAFAADPPPIEVTDEVNMLLARKYLLDPRSLMHIGRGFDPGKWGDEWLPFLPPQTHHHQDYPFIAKYPLEAWEHANRPSISPSGWRKLALSISMVADRSTPGNCKLLKAFDLTRELKQRSNKRLIQAGDNKEKAAWAQK